MNHCFFVMLFGYSIHYTILIDIFYPSGELISLQSLRCNPLAVVHYSFVGHCLAFTAT